VDQQINDTDLAQSTTDGAAKSDTTLLGGYYADDVPFRSGVVQQQAPLTMAIVAALNGINPPRPTGAFRYCDLGCGNGTTVNAFAALYPEAEFVGIDFNPGHIAQARADAEAAGLTNVRFIQGSFADLDDADLPPFDFIGMNGIYSWLDRDILPAVHRLVGRILRPGGLFYVEYMTMPGMIAVVPMWQLIQAMVPVDGRGSHERATRGLRVLEELSKTGLAYLDRHPTAKAATNGYVTTWHDNPNKIDHFAHSSMASGFRPRYVTEMCDEMADAGLSFAGRTPLAFNDPDLTVTLQQATLLRGVEDRPTRELLSDFMRNERNRRDLFVKAGEGSDDPAAARAFLTDEISHMARAPSGTPVQPLQLPGPRKLPLSGAGYDRVIAAADGRATTLAAANRDGALSDDVLIAVGHRLQAGGQYFLCEPGYAGAPLPEAPARLALTNPMNRVLLARARADGSGTPVIARAVGGTAMVLDLVETALLDGWLEAGYDGAVARAQARFADSQGKVKVNGEPRSLAGLTADELGQRLSAMARVRVPNLVRLGALAPA
jgi:SAM-dependent methyltransferase